MPYRKAVLVPGEMYHVFNRSIARVPMFPTASYFLRFLDLIGYYRFANTPTSFSFFKKLANEERVRILEKLQEENDQQVELLAFCLMDNHYHFLLKQISERGIARFISNIQNGYAKYLNVRTKRSGPLFQPMFKAVHIDTDEQLIHVSRYIHLNPATSYLVEAKDLDSYPWSSLRKYLNPKSSEYPFIDRSSIFTCIGNMKYREFVYDQVDYQRKLAEIKHLLLE